MATQLQTIRTEVLETAGLAADDVRFPAATLTRIINRALRGVSSVHTWPWNQDSETITTVAGTIAYTPADAAWQKTSRLRYDNRDLRRFQPRDAQKYINVTGAPVGYYIEEDQIHFVPTPNGAYDVEHVFYETEDALSGDTDTPDLPDRYIDWLVWESVKLVATMIRDGDLFAMADSRCRDWNKRAADDALRTTAAIKVQTRSDWNI